MATSTAVKFVKKRDPGKSKSLATVTMPVARLTREKQSPLISGGWFLG